MANKPRLKAPPGACDTQMHFYGAADEYPVAPTALFLPPPASVEQYRELQQRLGLQRVVVVQPSAYGKDNRCTLDAMAALGENARGVAVVDDSVTEAELRSLTDRGIRGIRFFMLPGGALTWDELEPMAARVQPYGWHVQLQLDGRLLPNFEERLKRLPCDLVIDHNGKFLEPVTPDDPAFRTLLRLLDDGRCWVKVSAPYETSKVGPPTYDDVGALAKALIKHAPERALWATNWPHPGRDPRPDDATLLNLLLDWSPDDETTRRILVDNPARLYGFA